MPGSVGDWRPSAGWPVLALRARLLACSRAFFADRGVTEVETPALVRHAVTDPHLANIPARLAGQPAAWWLHTSPEFHMKRLLAAGAPDIYQVCRVFRDGEQGRRHEPEFTMIEWYRHGLDLDGMIAETVALLASLAAATGQDTGPVQVLSYPALVAGTIGIDPLASPVALLRERVLAVLGPDLVDPSLAAALGDDADGWLDLLMSHRIMPALPAGALTVIRDYPASQAALARLDPADPRVALRFELFWRGLELANGYHELADPGEQRRRFAADRARRLALGRPDVAPDPRLLAALDAGLPDCAGVAAGFDRLMMAITGAVDIAAVSSFAGERR
jgi:lysyl-tRNA synthetase class 2